MKLIEIAEGQGDGIEIVFFVVLRCECADCTNEWNGKLSATFAQKHNIVVAWFSARPCREVTLTARVHIWRTQHVKILPERQIQQFPQAEEVRRYRRDRYSSTCCAGPHV